MMKSARMILPLMVFTATAFSAFGQDKSGGAGSIPENQLTAVKDRCSELQVQQGTTGSNEPETTQPERQTNQPGNDGSTSTNSGSQGNATFDVSSITLQDCINQGLVDNTGKN